MSRYALVDPTTEAVRRVAELTAEQVAALAPQKRQWIRPLVTDPQPTPTAQQRVQRGGYVVEAEQVRETWTLVDKTPEELAAEAAAAERETDYAQLRQVHIALRDGTGTQAERLRRVERVCARLLRDAAGD